MPSYSTLIDLIIYSEFHLVKQYTLLLIKVKIGNLPHPGHVDFNLTVNTKSYVGNVQFLITWPACVRLPNVPLMKLLSIYFIIHTAVLQFQIVLQAWRLEVKFMVAGGCLVAIEARVNIRQ